MKSKKAIIMTWVLALLPVVLVLINLPYLPDRVPSHWHLDGTVTYAGKGILWLLAGMSPALALLLQFLPRVDPRKRNYEKFQGLYDGFCVLLQFFLLTVLAITLSETFRPGRINVSRAVLALVSLLFLVIGSMVGKVKSNFFAGFKTPWALADPDVWNRTQRAGGRAFFVSGLAGLILAPWAPVRLTFGLFFLLVFGGVALVYFLSWKWWKEKESHRPEA